MSDKSIETINDRYYTGERPLFNKSNLQINNTIFGEGESPLKESDNIAKVQMQYPVLPKRIILMEAQNILSR